MAPEESENKFSCCNLNGTICQHRFWSSTRIVSVFVCRYPLHILSAVCCFCLLE